MRAITTWIIKPKQVNLEFKAAIMWTIRSEPEVQLSKKPLDSLKPNRRVGLPTFQAWAHLSSNKTFWFKTISPSLAPAFNPMTEEKSRWKPRLQIYTAINREAKFTNSSPWMSIITSKIQITTIFMGAPMEIQEPRLLTRSLQATKTKEVSTAKVIGSS